VKSASSKRALIATHNLVSYAGSEVFTLELATELREMGWDVTVATLVPGNPMVSEFQQRGLPVVDLLADQPLFANHRFDLAWIHHAPVLYHLTFIHRIEVVKLVFCSLSHFEALESVPAQRAGIHLLLANSIENRDFIALDLGLDPDEVIVFPNSVPGSYWRSPKKVNPPAPSRIAIISNHPPPEVLVAAVMLERSGLTVCHIGTGGKQVLITPDLLRHYDAVITIGKTVPYCFALKVPVYCYDHFGGPGWLDHGNLDLASRNNFSGRGFVRKTPEAIAHEIVAGYRDALHTLEPHFERAAKLLDLLKNLRSVIDTPVTIPEHRPLASEVKQVLKQHAQYIRLLKAQRHNEIEISKLNHEVQRVKSTISWRSTAPFRGILNVMQRLTQTLR
jgi:hypothetical protein